MTDQTKEVTTEVQANATSEATTEATTDATTETTTQAEVIEETNLEIPKKKKWEDMNSEEKKEAHKEIQGKKTISKKKIRYFNKKECADELKRLEKGKHQGSKYYHDIKKRARKIA